MFPLGTVLFPGSAVPLHVFEERYRRLVIDCLEQDATFGIVLIERGSEVGGGDMRCDVATRSRIAESHRFEDGRWAVVAEGVGRMRIHEWLDETRYPTARVSTVDMDDKADAERYEAVSATLRRCLAMAAELGDDAAPATLALPDDPVTGLDAVAASGPLTAFDAQKLLATPQWSQRCDALDEMLHELSDTLQRRLADR
jgi:Lon protease-like protein